MQQANTSAEKCPVFITAFKILFLSDDRKRTSTKKRESLKMRISARGLMTWASIPTSFTTSLLHLTKEPILARKMVGLRRLSLCVSSQQRKESHKIIFIPWSACKIYSKAWGHHSTLEKRKVFTKKTEECLHTCTQTRTPIKALSRGGFSKLVSVRNQKKNLTIYQFPSDKEQNQSHSHKRPEELVRI